MGSARWPLVTEQSPCHACGKPDWCSISSDGRKAICRRRNDGTGEHKVAASGQDYYLYELNGHGEWDFSGDGSRSDGESQEKADPQTLEEVYETLLDELPLSHTHRQDLHRRGLTEAHIKRGGYRSLPP